MASASTPHVCIARQKTGLFVIYYTPGTEAMSPHMREPYVIVKLENPLHVYVVSMYVHSYQFNIYSSKNTYMFATIHRPLIECNTCTQTCQDGVSDAVIFGRQYR